MKAQRRPHKGLQVFQAICPNVSMANGYFSCHNIHHKGTLSILLNKGQLVRRKQNEKIGNDVGLSASKPDHLLKAMIDTALMPQRDDSHRCPTCKVCAQCAPIESLTRKQKLDILLKRESPAITSDTLG